MVSSKFSKIFLAVLIIGIFVSGIHFAFAGSLDNNPAASGVNPTSLKETEVKNDNSPGFIINVLTFFSAKVLTFLSGFISNIIAFGNQVIDLPIVRLGFQTVLGIANLGFVLAIIVIAFATMFRLQSYAMKQTLWKLVVAALLVNFSLVIAGAFISVSNVFSHYFMSGFNGDLGTTLANALNPNALASVTGTSGFFGTILNPFKTIFATLASSIFILVFTLAIILTFASLAVMLLIRAISLAMLLIMMPLVWLAWIFPFTAGHWKKWWEQFLRWTFFAPIVLFFIYIVISSMGRVGNFNAAALGNSPSGQTSSGSGANLNQAALDTQTLISGGNTNEAFSDGLTLPNNFLTYASQLLIMIGLLMGGLMMANSFGTSLGGAAFGMAKGVGGKFSKWTGKLGKKAGLGVAGRAVGNQGMKNLTNKLATSKVPGAGLIARGLNKLGAKTEQTTQKMYEDDAKSYSGDRLQTAILTSWGARRAALMNKAAKDRDIKKDVKEKYFGDAASTEKIENEMSRAGYNPGEVAKTIGYNSEIMKAPEGKERDEAFSKLYDGFSSADWSKLSPQALIDPKFGEIITENLLERSTGSLAKIMPKAKKKEDVEAIKKQVNKVIAKMDSNGNVSDERRAEIKKIKDATGKHLASRITGSIGEEEKEEKKEESKKEEKKT